MRWNATSCLPIEIQFEDIDGGGVVHHPNYLRYLERARCHAMREIGVPFEKCLKDGVAFVVAEVHSKYLRPLQFGQRIYVLTRLAAVRKSSLKVYQKILLEPPSGTDLSENMAFLEPSKATSFLAQLRLVAVDLTSAKPIPLPAELLSAAGCPGALELQNEPLWSDVRLQPFAQDTRTSGAADK